MEKLKLKRRQPVGRGEVVRIDPRLLQRVEKVSCETGLSLKKVTDELVSFALDHLEIVDEEHSDDEQAS